MSAKILITMQHEGQRKQLGDCLERVGHEVIKLDTFHNAMDFLRSTDVDLIITDVHLQNGGSIFDFLRWVKGDPHLRDVPFVCFSAEPPEVARYLADGVRTAARSLGAARYITMDNFNASTFLHEIEWLIPEDQVGSHYSGKEDSAAKETGGAKTKPAK